LGTHKLHCPEILLLLQPGHLLLAENGIRETFEERNEILPFKVKGKFHLITEFEGPEGEYRYSSTLPSTSGLVKGA